MNSPPTFRLSLHTSSYTPAAAHSLFADLTNELGTNYGYTAGGVALTGVTWTEVNGVALMSISGSATWGSTTPGIPAHRYAVLYIDATLNSQSKPLVAWIVGNNTGGGTDIPLTAAGSNLVYNFPSGIFDIS